ncbi:MAG: hypothetical protein GKR89_35480 [Candidatus Latescibacteria bacterium]|nr:hypothetical protein [Candidatus Latescibacterota bacterium]
MLIFLETPYLRRQSKKLLQGVRSGDLAALSRVEKHLPSQRKDTVSSANSVFGLRDALLVIAREYGFPSWAKLKAGLNHGLCVAGATHGETLQHRASVPNPRDGIEQVFANLYRFSSKPRGKTKRIYYSYLLTRRAGNLLICNQGSLVTDYLDEIEALGGIDTQLIARYVDAKGGDYHNVLYKRFGCKLCYHEAERRLTRTKTKCPEATFGDEGLKIGDDFEAHLLPNSRWTGTTLFCWGYRDKNYLFTNSVVKQRDGEWDLHFNPELWPAKCALFSNLPKLQVDYLLPGESAESEEGIHRFTDRTRKSFSKAIKTKLETSPRGLKAGDKSDQLRVVTNWVSESLGNAIRSMDLFDVITMKVHGNCTLSLLYAYLEQADVVLLQNFRRNFRPDHPYLQALREHVQQGGGLLLADNRALVDDRETVSLHPFPEVAVRGRPAAEHGPHPPELVVDGNHPITGRLADKTRFTAAAHEHHDHRHLSYAGTTFVPGPQGQVCIRNAFGNPVLVAGQVGAGRVVMSGFYYGTDAPIEGAELRIYAGSLRWLSGLT